MSNIGTITWANVKGAIVSALFVGLFAMIFYVLKVGNIFTLDYKVMANIGAMAFLTGIASIAKNFLTDSNGKFLGLISTVSLPNQDSNNIIG